MSEGQKLKSQLQIMTELCKLLKLENALMKTQHQNECHKLIEKKEKLSLSYVEGCKYFAEHREIFSILNETQKNMFRNAALTLQSLTEENKRLIEVNQEAIRRLVSAIASDAKEQSQKTPLYTGEGLIDGEKGNPAALSFNQVL